MALQDELNKKRKEDQNALPGELLKANDKHVEELKKRDFSKQGIKPGEKIPPFALKNAVGKKIYSDLLLSKGPLVINFYRGGWCPYCNLELKALQRALPDFRKMGGDLVAISPESPDNSLTTAQKHNLEMEVLSDPDNKIARQYGIVYELPQYLREVYKRFGLDISQYNNSEKFELPLPATYVVNQDGIVYYAFANDDFTVRANMEDILDALKQISKKK